MSQNPLQFSAILTTHVPRKELLKLLSDLLQIQFPGMEIIIIDDAASEETAADLRKTIEESENDRVFYFEHDFPRGRGNCLNEALIHAAGKFLWAPVKANRVNQMLLKEALNRFSGDPAGLWVLDYNLPTDADGWLHEAENGHIPDDSCFIWNQQVLQTSSFFFNPFLSHLHGAELAMRISNKHVWHKTDPFFVIDDSQFISAFGKNLEEFYRTAHRTENDTSKKQDILKRFVNVDFDTSVAETSGNLLAQARQMLAQEESKKSLEVVNKFLKTTPNHREAVRIKVSALEKLRRHVEASELKHVLRNLEQTPGRQKEVEVEEEEKPAVSVPEDQTTNFTYTIVVPTAGVGKKHLEACIASLENNADPAVTELIVIDNASIDDTFDYLQQLQEKNFLNINVITNSTNAGFGNSLNQGFDAAQGSYILAMHSDVTLARDTLEQLTAGLKQYPQAAVIAPIVKPTTFAAQQPKPEKEDSFVQTDRIDSCCFMVKKDLSVRFDDAYGLAFFDMEDFCRQIIQEEKQILVATETQTEHDGGAVTEPMGLTLDPKRKWENRARFHYKWNEQPSWNLPEQGSIAERFEELGAPIDPSDPPEEWVEIVASFLTDEIRTIILRSDLSKRELITIASTLLMADQRELMRTLEDRMNNLDLPPAVLLLFIHYYFEKNIYSRCRHYLKKAGNEHAVFDLYRLKILVADKEIAEASSLLNRMMESYPCSPDLFSLAGILYRYTGDEDEAKSFMAMANQLDPILYPPEETAFELKF